MDRTIHFGDDAADARYRIQDTSSTGGDLVLAEDLDGGTVLLEYDYSASEWVSRGPVNLSGNDITDAGSVSAATLEATGSITDPEGNTVTSLSDPVRVTEDAVTFAESDVSVTTNSTVVIDDSIKLGNTVSRPQDGSSGTAGSGRGIIINPNDDLSEITVKVSSNTQTTQDVFVAEIDETIIAEATNGYSSGDSETLTANLTAGTDYIVGVYNDGVDYTFGVADNVSYPISGSSVDIVDGARNCHPDDGTALSRVNDRAYGIVSVTTQSNSGDALIEWDSGVPADIDSWDLATFQRTLDGETVTIDVEDGSGTVLFSDISQNFDISTVNTSKNVKLRANLSRSNTSNNPTLDYAARRFTR